MPRGKQANKEASEEEQWKGRDSSRGPSCSSWVTGAFDCQGKRETLASEGEAAGEEDESKPWREKSSQDVQETQDGCFF